MKYLLLLSFAAICSCRNVKAQQDIRDNIPTITHSLPNKKDFVRIVHDTVRVTVHDTVKIIVYKKAKPAKYTGEWVITDNGKIMKP